DAGHRLRPPPGGAPPAHRIHHAWRAPAGGGRTNAPRALRNTRRIDAAFAAATGAITALRRDRSDVRGRAAGDLRQSLLHRHDLAGVARLRILQRAVVILQRALHAAVAAQTLVEHLGADVHIELGLEQGLITAAT